MEYSSKLALVRKEKSFDKALELLQYVKKEKLRVPETVVEFGHQLLQNHRWRLGDEIWNVYEQVLIAALDVADEELVKTCLDALKTKFPGSSRVGRLEGMTLEAKGEYEKAEAIYDEILKENPANMLVWKRKIAILKAQRKTQDAIVALNELLKNFQTDQSSWLELGELHLSLGAYRYAAFCYEELVLLNPMDSIFHSRLADIYATIGGYDNMVNARKHYCHSIELNKNKNLRAYFGLYLCTKAIASNRNVKLSVEEAELNDRVHQEALASLKDQYEAKSTSELAEFVSKAFA